MGHDLDQVMRHAPGALAALRLQRDLLDAQINALEQMQKAHAEVLLQYKVTENGLVEDIKHLTAVPSVTEPEPPAMSVKERIRVTLTEMGQQMTGPEIAELTEVDLPTVRSTLSVLVREKKVNRVERGVFVASGA